MLVGSVIKRVAILGGARIPFARSYSAYATASNQEMLTAVFRGVVERFRLQGERLGDVAAGAVIKHSRDWNLTREAAQGCGLDPHTPAYDVQRACGTSLEATIDIGNKIALGQIEAGIAGGTDSISDAPIVYPRSYQQLLLASYRGRTVWERLSPWFGLRPKHFKPVLPAVVEPRTGLSMGQSTELMAKQWQVTRVEQDQLAYDSHLKAASAWREGFYDDLVIPYLGLKNDNNVRADTSLEKLGRLRPSFATDGTLTAGNSTPLTDGASAVLLGVLCTGVAFVFYYRLIARVGAPRTSTVTYLIPLFGVIWAWGVLGEPLTLTMALAGALILAGVGLSQRDTKR